MKRIIFYFLLIVVTTVFSSTFSYVQAQYEDRDSPVGNLTPPSPTASALAKYAEIPISKYTGTANISVPIYTAVSEKIQLPISLSYHSNGNKVEDIASWVGLGWSLNAGGVITRVVKGLPDDAESVRRPDNSFSSNAGYLYDSQFCKNLYDNHPEDYTDTELYPIIMNSKDSSPDIFFFNFNGYTGKFVFDEFGEASLFSESDLEISYTLTTNLIDPTIGYSTNFGSTIPNIRGGITSFTITTPDGMKYVFDEKEITGSFSKVGRYDADLASSDCSPQIYFPYSHSSYCESNTKIVNPAFTSWKLSKIYAANDVLNENHVFEFLYDNTFNYDNSKININNKEECGSLITPLVMNLNKTLNSIYWSTGSIGFSDIQNRYDLYYHGSITPEIEKSRALTRIKIRNSSGQFIKYFDFEYGLFNKTTLNCNGQLPPWFESHRNRLKLLSVQEFGGTESNPPYLFSYDETPLPPRHTLQKDFWGFYNGNNETNSLPTLYFYPDDDIANEKYQSSLCIYPRETYTGTEINLAGANRYPNEAFAKAGILTRITYPTGGYSEFDYELNSFKFESFLNHGNQEFLGGGLRVSSVTTSPANDSGSDIISSYNYTYENGQPSGKIVNLPSFGYVHSWLPSPYQGLTGDETIRIFSTSQGGLGETHGGFVGYEEVIVEKSGNGKTVNTYDVSAQYGNATFDYDPIANESIYVRSFTEGFFNAPQVPSLSLMLYPFQVFPSISNPNYDWGRGQLLEEKIYDESGSLLQFIENSYQVRNYTKVVSTEPNVSHFVISGQGAGDYAYRRCSKSYYISAFKYLQQSIVHEYSNTGNLVTTTTFSHSDHHIKPISISKSNGSLNQITSIVYAQEATSSSGTSSAVLSEMVTRNMIHIPIETITSDALVTGSRTKYDFFTDNDGTIRILPYKVYNLVKSGWRLQGTFSYWPSGNAKGYPSSFRKGNDNNSTFFTWDNKKRLATKSYIDWEWTYGYNSHHSLLEQITDMDGQVINYVYDGLLRLETITARNGNVVTTNSYQIGGGVNSIGSVTAFTDGTPAQSTSQVFDGLGRPISNSVNGVEKGSFLYDNIGRVAQQMYLPGDFMTLGYESSPLNRLTSEAYPDGSTTTMSYGNDGIDYRQTVIDENGHATSGYTNMIGQQVLTTDALNNNTSYLYYPEGNLHQVTAPDGSSYDYTYDQFNRMDSKIIPAGGLQEFVYNDQDLLVASQDANLLGDGRWLATSYDVYGRPVSTGFYGGDPTTNPNSVVPTEILSTTYYDNFVNNNLPGFPFGVAVDGTCATNAMLGKAVGSKVNILDGKDQGPEWIYTTNCLDEYGRVVKTKSTNHLGGYDTNTFTLNLADNPSDVIRNHQLIGADPITVSEHFEYDNFFRLESTDHQINVGSTTGDIVRINSQSYNDKDQLTSKRIYGAASSSPLQSINYTYNIRGWLTHINEVPTGGDDETIPDCDTEVPRECGPVCDYEVTISGYTDEVELPIIGIYVKGDMLMDLNYPIYPTFGGLENDIEQWLWDNNYAFESVSVSAHGNDYKITIVGSSIVFNKVRQYSTTKGVETYFSGLNCDGPELPDSPIPICDLCERDGYKCDRCPYWELDEPCTTCQLLDIANCTNCEFAEDICTRCENLGYADCSSCPLSVGKIRPLNISVAYNHNLLSSSNPNPLLVRVSDQSIVYLHDGTARLRESQNMAVVGQGALTYSTSATYPNLMEIELGNEIVTLNTFDAVVASAENQIMEELISAGITNATVQNDFVDAVIAEAAAAWTGPTDAEDPADSEDYAPNPDLFSMELIYNGGHPMVSSNPQYNGNISGMVWKTGFGAVNSYSFEYDAINRLESGLFRDDLGGGNYALDNKYGVSFTYDNVGNIQTLSRRGVDDFCTVAPADPVYEFTQIDHLQYFYTGSQLTYITENSNQTRGFKGTGGSYTYDANGNMVGDQNKQMNATYNHLNLPYLIDLNDNSINFTYDAAGTKLQKHAVGTDDNGAVNNTTDYLGGIEYKNGEIEAIYHGEGRVRFDIDKYDNIKLVSEYYLKDHLGNVRVVFSDLNENGFLEPYNFDPNNPLPSGIDIESELIQENNYYPFGMEMEGPWDLSVSVPENKYLFSGVERIKDFDLNIDFATFRSYDPSIGRWWQVDPKSELFHAWTPYKFSLNNPILYNDPNGDCETCKGILKEYGSQLKYAVTQVFNGAKSGVSKLWNKFSDMANNPSGGMILTDDSGGGGDGGGPAYTGDAGEANITPLLENGGIGQAGAIKGTMNRAGDILKVADKAAGELVKILPAVTNSMTDGVKMVVDAAGVKPPTKFGTDTTEVNSDGVSLHRVHKPNNLGGTSTYTKPIEEKKRAEEFY